jgi:hypothetical protein
MAAAYITAAFECQILINGTILVNPIGIPGIPWDAHNRRQGKGGRLPKAFILEAPFVCRSDTHSHRLRNPSSDRSDRA